MVEAEVGNSTIPEVMNTMVYHEETSRSVYALDNIGENAVVVQVCFSIIATTGVLGNSIAICVLLKSKEIRTTLASSLLISQSVSDLIACSIIMISMPVGLMWAVTKLYGTWGQFLCLFWFSDFTFYSAMTISSYNLVMLSVERAVSVIWPIFHRTKVTKTSINYMVGFAWSFGVTMTLEFLIPTSGVVKGICKDWNIFPSSKHRQVIGMMLTYKDDGNIGETTLSWLLTGCGC